MSKGIGFTSAILILVFVLGAVFIISAAWNEISIEPPTNTTLADTSTIIPTLTSFLPYFALIVIVTMLIGIFITFMRMI